MPGHARFFLFYYDWKWAEGEAHLKEAIRLAPEAEPIRPFYALLLGVTGRTSAALEQIDFALAQYEVSHDALARVWRNPRGRPREGVRAR